MTHDELIIMKIVGFRHTDCIQNSLPRYLVAMSHGVSMRVSVLTPSPGMAHMATKSEAQQMAHLKSQVS